ncbi:MAG: DUF1045 domain-containing protein [Hyphomicrobiaceae bacterium]|nr:DUF1045 domain-containing protein [Hyphomicrobiaceae bacterium]
MGTPAPRYAIYFLPGEGSALARFGARWFGYDCLAGHACRRESFGLGDLATRAVEGPARYGFHATLVAPFHLRPPVTIDDVLERLHAVAVSRRAPEPPLLSMHELGGFLALRPGDDLPLRRLAVACLFACNPLRAELSKAERDRRLRSPLTPYQRILMKAYGYPYVMDEYRFHITLTGKLEEMERKYIESALAEVLSPILVQPVPIDAISLLEQTTPDAPFRFHSRVQLSA